MFARHTGIQPWPGVGVSGGWYAPQCQRGLVLGMEGRDARGSRLQPGPAGSMPPSLPLEALNRVGELRLESSAGGFMQGTCWWPQGQGLTHCSFMRLMVSMHRRRDGEGMQRSPPSPRLSYPWTWRGGSELSPEALLPAHTCGEGGEEPGVALCEGGVADPAEIEHHGSPHNEHHVPTA